MLNNISQSSIELPLDIISKIYDVKNNAKTAQLRTNVNGWQSKQYQKGNEIPWVNNLLSKCLLKLNLPNYEVRQFWFNISPPGAYHTWHSHGKQAQVGVCYIQVPKDSGNIEFRFNDITEQIEPSAGMLITFPAGLDHRVLINNSTEDRITLAFNLQSKG